MQTVHQTPRRLLSALAAAAVLPLSVAPLAPAFAEDAVPAPETSEALPPTQVPEPTQPAPDPGTVSEPVQQPLPEPAPPVDEPIPAVADPSPVPESQTPEAPAPAAAPAAPAAETPAEPTPAAATATAAAPGVTANLGSTPASGWYRTRQPIRFVAADGGSGVRSITVVIDGTTTERAGSDTTVYVEGNGRHSVEYWATDLIGNSGAPKSLAMAIDETGPRIATGAPHRIAQGDEVPLGLSCVDEHSGVQSCIAEGLPDEMLPSDELGAHTVALYALDHAGNETAQTFEYVVEERPAAEPELRFAIAPEPFTGWYRGPVGVTVSASTPDGADRITGVYWWTDGPVSASGGGEGESEATFTIEADGVTEVTYRATTARGALGEGRATVRIDGVQPEVTFLSPTPTQPGDAVTIEQGTAVNVEFECSDAHSGVDFCGAELPLLPSAASALSGTDGSLPLDTSALGSRSVVVETADVAGNRAKAVFEYEVVPAGNGGADGGSGGADGGGSGSSGGGSGADGGGSNGGGSQNGAGDGKAPEQPGAERPTGFEGKVPRLARTGAEEALPGVLGAAIAAAGAALLATRLRARRR